MSPPRLFAVTRARGPAWRDTRALEAQPGWAGNADEARARLAEDPWAAGDLLRVSRVVPWTPRLGSLGEDRRAGGPGALVAWSRFADAMPRLASLGHARLDHDPQEGRVLFELGIDSALGTVWEEDLRRRTRWDAGSSTPDPPGGAERR